MNRSRLLSILQYNFPGNVGIALTGSQKTNEEFLKDFDIDLIVIDKYSSDVHSYGIDEDGYRMDCTVIPLFDLENIILNENEHEKGILFSMILKGVFLHGNQHLFQWMQQKAKEYLTIEPTSVKLAKTSSFNELTKSLKYLKRGLGNFDRIILLSELIFHLGTLAMMDIENRDSRHLKRALAIQSKHPGLAKEIELAFESLYLKNDPSIAIDLVERRLKQKKDSKADNEPSTTHFYELSIENFSLSEYYEFIEPAIVKFNTVLHNALLFSYLSPKKYYRIFKGDVTICFSLEEQPASQILSILTNVLNGILNTRQYKITTTPATHLLLIEDYQTIYLLKKYWQKSTSINFLAIAIISDLVINCQYDVTEIVDLNKALLQKWILTKEEQSHVRKHSDILKIIQKRTKVYDAFYHKNKRGISKFCSKEFLDETSGSTLGKLRNTFNERIRVQIENISITKWLKDYPPEVLETLGLTSTKKSTAYIQIVDELFRVLDMSDAEKAESIYSSSLFLLDF